MATGLKRPRQDTIVSLHTTFARISSNTHYGGFTVRPLVHHFTKTTTPLFMDWPAMEAWKNGMYRTSQA